MDSTHGKVKRMIAEDDRLSSLPDDLIHKILSSIGIKHVVQTSVLSSRWRFIWTSMPYLSFSRDDFVSLSKFSEFVTHVLSDRNNQSDVSSVKLSLGGEDSDVFVKQIMTYAIDHNIQQLNVEFFLKNDVEFPISSQSLKNLSLTKETYYRRSRSSSYVIKATSTWELPLLTTLYLHNVTLCCDEKTDKCIGFFSKCVNLKILTLEDCNTKGFKGLSICLPILSNLTLEDVSGSVNFFNLVAPQLKNLIIRGHCLLDLQCRISAPNLVSLLFKGYRCVLLSTDDFPFLDKADICISLPMSKNAHQILGLLQKLHNVKSLTLNLEIVELLSESVELMSDQPSPFANLKSLKIHPERENAYARDRAKMSAEVKRYLLDSSPGVNFSITTREDIKAMNDAKFAQSYITELRELLEQENARTETQMAKMHELGKARYNEHIDSHIYRYNNSYWEYLSKQIKKGREKTSQILTMLQDIKSLLKELPASNLATVQPSFSILCAEVDIVMSKITDCIKMACDENQRCLSVCFRELATTLEPSS